MAIRSLGHSTSPYDAVMGQTGENTGVKDYDPPLVTGYGARGMSGGGNAGAPSYSNVIDYITIANTGNATDFGDLSVARNALGGSGGAGRGTWWGGWLGSRSDTIDYVTAASTGNASDFGNMTVERSPYQAVCGSGTRGVCGGGHGVPGGGDSTTDIIDYITYASTGNATDFGDLTQARTSGAALSNNTRGIFIGGSNQTSPYPRYNTIDYVTIASTGNATDFGDQEVGTSNPIGNSNLTRGVWAQGYQGSPVNATINGMSYLTIASTGNASDFGDMLVTKAAPTGMSSGSGDRATWAGGNTSGGKINSIEYVTISSTGNGTDFGDLTTTVYYAGGCAQDT